MSIINCTLIVQAFNFFIAFCIIKFFFFKTAVAHIRVEDTLEETLIGTVQEHQAIVTQKEHDILAHWNAARSNFAKTTPSLKPEQLFIGKLPSIVLPKFDKETIANDAGIIAKELAKKVSHVH